MMRPQDFKLERMQVHVRACFDAMLEAGEKYIRAQTIEQEEGVVVIVLASEMLARVTLPAAQQTFAQQRKGAQP